MRRLSLAWSLAWLALVGTFAWKLIRRRRRHPSYAPYYEAPYILEERSPHRNPWPTDARAALGDTMHAVWSAARLGARGASTVVTRARGGVRERQATPIDLDEGSVAFEWLVRTSNPAVVRDALEAAGIAMRPLDPLQYEREDAVAERLEAVGMHLDEEAGSGVVQSVAAGYGGTTSPRRLANAFEAALRQAHTGFIVDASRAGEVLIDGHHAVGTGVLALIEPHQARLTHGESGRAFFRAAWDAAARSQ